jgi:hypothetical protein
MHGGDGHFPRVCDEHGNAIRRLNRYSQARDIRDQGVAARFFFRGDALGHENIAPVHLFYLHQASRRKIGGIEKAPSVLRYVFGNFTSGAPEVERSEAALARPASSGAEPVTQKTEFFQQG